MLVRVYAKLIIPWVLDVKFSCTLLAFGQKFNAMNDTLLRRIVSLFIA